MAAKYTQEKCDVSHKLTHIHALRTRFYCSVKMLISAVSDAPALAECVRSFVYIRLGYLFIFLRWCKCASVHCVQLWQNERTNERTTEDEKKIKMYERSPCGRLFQY